MRQTATHLLNDQVNVLTSWKAIAVYLGKGVRTVQRWEHELDLPVRRPYKGERASVIALVSELSDFIHGCRLTSGKVGDECRTSLRVELTSHLIHESAERRWQSRSLRAELRSARLQNESLRHRIGEQRDRAWSLMEAMVNICKGKPVDTQR